MTTAQTQPKRPVEDAIAELNALLDKAYTEVDPADRDQLLDEVQNHLSAKWDDLTDEEGTGDSSEEEDSDEGEDESS